MREHGKHSVGRSFGYYTVLEVEIRINKNKSKTSWAKAKCKCGNIKWIRVAALKSGTTRSCGCYATNLRKSKKGVKSAQYKHGHYINKVPSPTMSCWSSMMTRCYYKNSNRYNVYGAVGIGVCTQWHDFEIFLKDMGERPSKNHTLDRIDNAKGYEPGNVRWASKRDQAINRKTTKFFTINNETKCLKDWAKHYGINYIRVYRRIFQLKWDIVKALTTPIKNYKDCNDL